MSSTPPISPPGGYDPRTNGGCIASSNVLPGAPSAMPCGRSNTRGRRRISGVRPRVPSVVGPLILMAIGIVALLIYDRPHCSGGTSGAGRPMVAAAADRGRTGDAGRMGAGFAARNSGAPRDGICRHPDSAGRDWILRLGNDPWNVGPWANNWGDHDDNNFFNMFGLPEHDMDQQVMNIQIPSDARDSYREPARRCKYDRRRLAEYPGISTRGGVRPLGRRCQKDL